MQSAQSASPWINATLIVTALGLGFLTLTLDTRGGSGGIDTNDVSTPPAAILAWAKLHCDPNIEVGAAPLTSGEALISTVAFYDSAVKSRSLSAVCLEASAVTAGLRGTVDPDVDAGPDAHVELLAVRSSNN